MSYGLRYEYYRPLHDVNNKAVIFDILKGDIVAGQFAGVVSIFHRELRTAPGL